MCPKWEIGVFIHTLAEFISTAKLKNERNKKRLTYQPVSSYRRWTETRTNNEIWCVRIPLGVIFSPLGENGANYRFTFLYIQRIWRYVVFDSSTFSLNALQTWIGRTHPVSESIWFFCNMYNERHAIICYTAITFLKDTFEKAFATMQKWNSKYSELNILYELESHLCAAKIENVICRCWGYKNLMYIIYNFIVELASVLDALEGKLNITLNGSRWIILWLQERVGGNRNVGMRPPYWVLGSAAACPRRSEEKI